MDDPTSLLMGLEGFAVIDVQRVEGQPLQVVIETCENTAGCPDCGVISTRIKDRPLVRIKDLPASGQRVQLWWRKRRLLCAESACPRRSFTEISTAIRPRARVTERLRLKVAEAVCSSNRSVVDVSGEYGVSWHTTHQALIERATTLLPQPEPTRVLGIDETRTRRVRWYLQSAGWKRSNPWMTSFVDADPAGAGCLLGLMPGRSGKVVQAWLQTQTELFRDRVQIVVIDPFRAYASGAAKALPEAKIAVDKWHVIKLATDTIDEVRKRVSKTALGRRGTTKDPVWSYRNLFLTGAERLSDKQRHRLEQILTDHDPTGELRHVWQAKERLRDLMHCPPDHHRIRQRLCTFYETCAEADMPELTRLATTIDEWWPAILTAIQTGITNARTEGLNRIVKQVKRTGCGFTNMDNYHRRVKLVTAANRPHQQPT